MTVRMPEPGHDSGLTAVGHGAVHVIQVAAELDPATATELELAVATVAATVAATPRPALDSVVIDLTRTTGLSTAVSAAGTVSAAATGALQAAARTCADRLTLRVVACGQALRALRLTGLHDYLAVHETLDGALNLAQPAGPGQLRCVASVWSGYTLITATGECDITTSGQLDRMLTARAARVILCLTGVRFLDSSGLHMLLSARARLAGEDATLLLVNPRPNVAKIFELTGADSLFRSYPTLAAAIDAH